MESTGAITLEPALDLDAMASIVRELVAGGTARLQDRQWLQARAKAMNLCNDAVAALDALRQKLHRRVALLADDGTLTW
jgi:hypothetical protein